MPWRWWWTMPLLITFGMLLPGMCAPTAHADGTISPVEKAYMRVVGPDIICPLIVTSPHPETVLDIAEAITADGFSSDDAVDVLNASVANYCPDMWWLLAKTGRQARGELV